MNANQALAEADTTSLVTKTDLAEAQGGPLQAALDHGRGHRRAYGHPDQGAALASGRSREDGKEGIADGAFGEAAREKPVSLHVADFGLNAAAPPERFSSARVSPCP